MGLTPDQKLDLILAYINKCDDFLYLCEIEDAAYLRLTELLKDRSAGLNER